MRGQRKTPAGPSPARTFTEKLNVCFSTMHPGSDKPFTVQQVASAVQELGVSLSESYLFALRTGRRDNPTLRQMQALAAVFEVPTAYFVGSDEESERIDVQLGVIRAVRDQEVADVAMRASSLTPVGLRALMGVLKQLEQTPGLVKRVRRRRTADAGDASSQSVTDDESKTASSDSE
ncbi:XRE family transcriptional regulator [Enterococcus hirae]|nr:XRE family transcriptional regulator [Enterococcus hirae]